MQLFSKIVRIFYLIVALLSRDVAFGYDFNSRSKLPDIFLKGFKNGIFEGINSKVYEFSAKIPETFYSKNAPNKEKDNNSSKLLTNSSIDLSNILYLPQNLGDELKVTHDEIVVALRNQNLDLIKSWNLSVDRFFIDTTGGGIVPFDIPITFQFEDILRYILDLAVKEKSPRCFNYILLMHKLYRYSDLTISKEIIRLFINEHKELFYLAIYDEKLSTRDDLLNISPKEVNYLPQVHYHPSRAKLLNELKKEFSESQETCLENYISNLDIKTKKKYELITEIYSSQKFIYEFLENKIKNLPEGKKLVLFSEGLAFSPLGGRSHYQYTSINTDSFDINLIYGAYKLIAFNYPDKTHLVGVAPESEKIDLVGKYPEEISKCLAPGGDQSSTCREIFTFRYREAFAVAVMKRYINDYPDNPMVLIYGASHPFYRYSDNEVNFSVRLRNNYDISSDFDVETDILCKLSNRIVRANLPNRPFYLLWNKYLIEDINPYLSEIADNNIKRQIFYANLPSAVLYSAALGLGLLLGHLY